MPTRKKKSARLLGGVVVTSYDLAALIVRRYGSIKLDKLHNMVALTAMELYLCTGRMLADEPIKAKSGFVFPDLDRKMRTVTWRCRFEARFGTARRLHGKAIPVVRPQVAS